MSKSVSVYLDEQDFEILDRLAKAERRSRSAMISELIRRYFQLTQMEDLRQHPLFRSYSSQQLADFMKEDRLTPSELNAYRKLFGRS